MRICLCRTPDRIEVRRRDEAGGRGDSVLAADTAHEALALLRRYLWDRDALPQLRELADRGPHAGDDEVLGVIAAAIGSGRLQLVRSERHGGGVVPAAAAQAAPPSPRRPAVREPAPLPPPRARPAPADAPVAEEASDGLAQDVQAATLRDAAVLERPFCEVCRQGAP
jgi:hypothetical protein